MIPALNELRYAGHHVIQCISPETGQVTDVNNNLQKAHGHCERALYEASEAGLMAAVKSILAVRDRYPDVVISEVVRDYPDSLMRAHSAKKMVVAGRADRKSVLEHTEDYMRAFRELAEDAKRLASNGDDLTLKQQAAVRSSRAFVLQCIAVVFGGALLLLGILRYFG